MRISWLTAEEVAAARKALTANGATWSNHFTSTTFTPPPIPTDVEVFDWANVVEHVARAERVSEVVRDRSLAHARLSFGDSGVAIEAATLASAAHEDETLGLDEVLGVLGSPIDGYVFYAPFLELAMSFVRVDPSERDRVIAVYEAFVDAYARGLADVPYGRPRVDAVRDGLADIYVHVGRLDDAQTLFERRHEEDQRDVAVALSASRAFLAAGATTQGIHWLGIGASRATALGRVELAAKLRQKQDAFRKRLS
ncbi:MAG: hypothetical protein NT062_32240 [Proteobacteria bacterium]|nr:hypothetical protein [Pseudomonadota bacterium]